MQSCGLERAAIKPEKKRTSIEKALQERQRHGAGRDSQVRLRGVHEVSEEIALQREKITRGGKTVG